MRRLGTLQKSGYEMLPTKQLIKKKGNARGLLIDPKTLFVEVLVHCVNSLNGTNTKNTIKKAYKHFSVASLSICEFEVL